MKFYTRRNFYLFLAAGVLCLISSFYLDKIRVSGFIDIENNRTIKNFKATLNKEIEQMKNTFAQFPDGKVWKENKKIKGFGLQIYNKDSLIYWDDNAIENLNPSLFSEPFSIKILNNGIFLIGIHTEGNKVVALFYLIRNNYQTNNDYLKNSFNPDFNINYPGVISLKADEGYCRIELSEGVVCFTKFDIQKSYSFPGFVLFLMALLFLFLSLRYLLQDLFKIDYVLGISMLFLVVLTSRIIMSAFHFPQYFYTLDIFNPHYFASSDFFQSFGDLVVTVVLLAVAILVSTFYLAELKASETLRVTATGKTVLLFYIFNASLFTFKIIHDLVIDSKISFDLTNAFDLSGLSLAGVLLILLMYVVTINLSHVFSRVYANEKLISINNGIRLTLIIGWIAFLHSIQKEHFHWLQIFIAALFILLLDFAKKLFKQKSFVIRHLIYAVFFVMMAAISFYINVNENELADRILYANRLTTQIDYKAEELLNTKEHEILSDSTLFDNCLNSGFTNAQAGQYLAKKYINNYLEKYDCGVYYFINDSFNANPYNYSVYEFDNTFKNQGIQGLSSYFRFIKSPSVFLGYIGKLEITKHNRNIKLYVLLTLQPYQEDNLLPILLAGKTSAFQRNKRGYSYAIYNNNKLMQQAGRFQYQTLNNFDSPDTTYKIINTEGYSHLLCKDTKELLIVVTSIAPSLLSILANALCLYILTILLGGLLIFSDFLVRLFFTNKQHKILDKARYAWKRTSLKYDLFNFKFSSRIVINILGLVLFIFTLTSIFTIRYINSKINEEARTALITKLKSINKYFSEDKILVKSNLPGEAEANVQKASALFATDINIYDANGKLFISSKPEIFNEGLLSRYVNYDAFFNILNKNASIFTENENIGELQYTSYYQPYYDKNRNLKFIINTPYFARTIEHNAQISMFIINFFNLYVALLLLMFIIAYWVAQGTTSPFILLRDKIKALRLDRENELLSWQRNDEIGELIKQYNSMVLDLKESKLNLANAERTEAWREMAKQVAHDIKNPLTPMKLNLQYLLKAMEENDEELQAKFISVSKSLIKQIDSLSEMADNFSNFAKAPDANPQELNIAEELGQIIELYKATDFVEIKSKFSPSEIYIMMDKNHFSRAIGNIIKNAIQAIPPDKEGLIEIDLNSTADFCILSIKDNGIGIQKEMEHLVFIPNFSTKTSGSGIGLGITKSLVENAGGSIYFESVPNQGTTFYVKLPIHKHDFK